MIEHIKIKNVALLRNVSIDFSEGFNVLLGETGAGKSIILDALNFVLGAKADKELITTGEESLRVEASFSSYSKDVDNELSELGIEQEENLIISRTLTIEGKSDIRINGNSATLSMLKSVTKYLVDSYSQHENLILLKPKNHLGILDSFNNEILNEEKQKLSEVIIKLKDVSNQLGSIGGNTENRERMIDLLKFQIEEIEALKPKVVEEEEIIATLAKYNNSEKIATGLSEAVTSLDGNEYSALSGLKNAIRNLTGIENFSNEYVVLNERLKSTMYELEDIATSLRQEQRGVTFDEKQYEILDAKLDRYKMIKKKYGGSIEKILEYLTKTKVDYDNLVNAEEKLAELEKQKQNLVLQGNNICKILTDKRKAIANEIEGKIKNELFELGMKNAQFKVDFSVKENFDAQGKDDVEFLFSANAGMDLKPLSKIISGGEMSRFSLAVKNIIKGEKACLVFDEIDAGISGEIGGAVAQRIATLAKNNQVICISHSAQVCAMADSFNHVTKHVENQKTYSTVNNLKEDEIVVELAKISSGKLLGDVAIAHAKQLLARANEFKSKL